MSRKPITKTAVDAAMPSSRDAYLWDDKLVGFGLKVTPAGNKVYLVQYREQGGKRRTRRVTIGKHGAPWTPQTARDEAKKLLARIDLGESPAEHVSSVKKEPTIERLAEVYFVEHVEVHNKPTTQRDAKRLLNKRIKPSFGNYRLSELTSSKVQSWYNKMKDMPYEANRALSTLSRMMRFSLNWDENPDRFYLKDNPCKDIQRFSEKARDRHFDDEEMARIGAALSKAYQDETYSKGSIDAFMLAAFTGMRIGEILTLRWEDVDLSQGIIFLKDAKTGDRVVRLASDTMELIASIGQDGDYLCHGKDPDQPLSYKTFRRLWDWVKKEAALENARPHDLRHTAATTAARANLNAFQVRDLLGHKSTKMADRYVSRAEDEASKTANLVAGRVASAMKGKPTDEVAEWNLLKDKA